MKGILYGVVCVYRIYVGGVVWSVVRIGYICRGCHMDFCGCGSYGGEIVWVVRLL